MAQGLLGLGREPAPRWMSPRACPAIGPIWPSELALLRQTLKWCVSVLVLLAAVFAFNTFKHKSQQIAVPAAARVVIDKQARAVVVVFAAEEYEGQATRKTPEKWNASAENAGVESHE